MNATGDLDSTGITLSAIETQERILPSRIVTVDEPLLLQ